MVNALWLGRRAYLEGLRLQEEAFHLVHAGRLRFVALICSLFLTKQYLRNVICMLEHSPVYTVGLRDSQYTTTEERELRRRGADFQRCERQFTNRYLAILE